MTVRHTAGPSRRLLFVVVLLGLTTILICTAGVGAEEPSPTIPPAIVAGSEYDYPPFCIVTPDGAVTGFSVELFRAALAAMGREATFRVGPWSEVRGWLEHGEVEALPLVGRTPEREGLFDFTFPYMSLHGAIVVRDDTTDIGDLADLRGRQVAVMKGDSAEEFLRREDRGIEIVTTPTFEVALRELSEGRHDAVVIQRLVALQLLQETGLRNLRVLNKPIESFRQDFCFAVREGGRDTLALLNKGLSLVMADGTYRYLRSKWFAGLELPSDRRLVIGGDHNYPPFEYLDDDGRPTGFNVALTRAIAREVGLDIEIRLGPWAEIVRGLEEGDIDAIQGMFYSPERDLRFDFTQPYAVSHYVGIVRKGEGSPPTDVDDLRGKAIVIQRGDVIHDFLMENGLGDQVSVVETQEDVLREVAQGRYDCALVVRTSASYLIDKYGWTNLDLGKRPFISMDYCYAVRDGELALLAQLSDGLALLKHTGEYQRLYREWLGVYEDIPPDLGTILRYVGMVAAPLLLIVMASLAWTRSLHREVARRTEELRESEARLQALFDYSPLGIAVFTPDGRFVQCNQAMVDLLGYSAEELAVSEPTHPDDVEVGKRLFRRLAEGEIDGYQREKRYIRRDGTMIWSLMSAAAVPGPDGTPRYLVLANQDITQGKRAQEHVEHLNRVLRAIRNVNQLIVRERDRDALINKACRTLVDARDYAAALIVLTNDEGHPVTWAQAGMSEASELLDAMVGLAEIPPCCVRTHAEPGVLVLDDRDHVCESCPISAVCTEGVSLAVSLTHDDVSFGYLIAVLYERLEVDPDERALFAELAGDLAYALHNLQVMEASQKAMRDRRVLEDQLAQAQKMEAVGRLAGGVAHDFNNMLSVIIGHAELAMRRLDADHPLRDDLHEIHGAAQRSADLTRQLLGFARRQTIDPKVLDLNETVEGMLKMLRRLLREEIELVWLPDSGEVPVKMDPSQIDQILANLCVNARDAITGMGTITIKTGRVVLDAEDCADKPDAVPGQYAVLQVSDNGSGMDEDTLSHLFEPFFTTKSTGKGTGLGLATVYGIVRQNEGFIDVCSEPGHGSTFTICLPLYAEGPIGHERLQRDTEIPKGQGETILLVEDEAAILDMGRRMLETLGYRVLATATAAEAIRLAEEAADGIHLLITDVVMPEMDGRELAGRVGALHPAVKSLFMSGYTSDVIAHRGVLDEGVQFLQKPFTMRALAIKVRGVLDGL